MNISGRTLLFTLFMAALAPGFMPLQWSNPVLAATLPAGFTESIITEPMAKVTAMAFAPDGKLYIIQQAGAMQVYDGAGASMWTQVAPAGNFFSPDPLNVSSENERGLDGIAIDPDFENNRYLYVYYAFDAANVRNRVSRFTANADGTQVVPGSETVIIELENVNSNIHNGAAMHFGPDGKLYVSVGDDANPANSQSITTRFGKVLRLNANPSNPIPSDNPTTIDGIPGTLAGPNRMIWAAGLRNPFTMAFHPWDGRMYINDVGQNTYEEVNLGQAGANYGWGTTEGPFDEVLFPDFSHPLIAYPHPGMGADNYPAGLEYTGFAVTGGVFYVPDVPQFPSLYNGKYFFADFVSHWIKYYDSNANAVFDFAEGARAPVDLDVGPDGALYYLARYGKFFEMGWVYRVVSTIAPCPADLTGSGGAPDDVVNVIDLFQLLGNWNSSGPGANLAPPTNLINASDLFVLLAAWGDC